MREWLADTRTRAVAVQVARFAAQVAVAALAAAGLVTEGCAGELRALVLGVLV